MTNDLIDRNRQELARIIKEQHDDLLKGIRVLLWKTGMAGSEKEVDDLSTEILQETVVTAFEIAARFDSEKSGPAWLLGIAANKIKERRNKETRRGKRTGLATETYLAVNQKSKASGSDAANFEQITEDEMIDFLIAKNVDTNPLRHKIHLSFDELVSLVGSDDRFVLKLAFVENMRGIDLAATLKISTGAANVRLSRAISRLREAYLSSEQLTRGAKNE